MITRMHVQIQRLLQQRIASTTDFFKDWFIDYCFEDRFQNRLIQTRSFQWIQSSQQNCMITRMHIQRVLQRLLHQRISSKIDSQTIASKIDSKTDRLQNCFKRSMIPKLLERSISKACFTDRLIPSKISSKIDSQILLQRSIPNIDCKICFQDYASQIASKIVISKIGSKIAPMINSKELSSKIDPKTASKSVASKILLMIQSFCF